MISFHGDCGSLHPPTMVMNFPSSSVKKLLSVKCAVCCQRNPLYSGQLSFWTFHSDISCSCSSFSLYKRHSLVEVSFVPPIPISSFFYLSKSNTAEWILILSSRGMSRILHFSMLKNCSTNVDFNQIRQTFLIHSLSLQAAPNIDHLIRSNSRKRISWC